MGPQGQHWSIRVRWHPYDGRPTRTEYLELPPDLHHAGAARMEDWISSHLREREGLPPDSHQTGERVLWFECDFLRPTEEVPE